MYRIVKRDGKTVDFDLSKISEAIKAIVPDDVLVAVLSDKQKMESY